MESEDERDVLRRRDAYYEDVTGARRRSSLRRADLLRARGSGLRRSGGDQHQVLVHRAMIHQENEVSEGAGGSPADGQNRKRYINEMNKRSLSRESPRQSRDDRESRRQYSRSPSVILPMRSNRRESRRRSRCDDYNNFADQNSSRLSEVSSDGERYARKVVGHCDNEEYNLREHCIPTRRDLSRGTVVERTKTPQYKQDIDKPYNHRKRRRSHSSSFSPTSRCTEPVQNCVEDKTNMQTRYTSTRTKLNVKTQASETEAPKNSHSSGRKRRSSRSLSSSPIARRTRDEPTTDILDKFMSLLKDMKGNSSSKLSLHNVIPEFDPMAKNQTILTWLTKVEECAEIYGWSNKETIHFALPKLSGVAKSWYEGLDTIRYTWVEWKRKLIESFPCRDDYAELLTMMLAKRARYGESLEHYYYEKINLLNRCAIKGRKAVDCLLHGIEDRAVRVGAQAAQFHEPEEVLKYLKTIKVGSIRDSDRPRLDKRSTSGNMTRNPSRPKTEWSIKPIKCYNCNTEGHKSFECSKPANKCTICSKIGHLDIHCRTNKTQPKTSFGNCKVSESKEEKQVAELTTSQEINRKYIIDVEVNGNQLECYVDLGSQCTLLRKQVLPKLGLTLETDRLPVMRGIGGHCFTPIGRCDAEVTVQGIKENIEIFVVDDDILKYPMLLGHSFTERSNITITKTPQQIIFEKLPANSKIFLTVLEDVVIPRQEMRVVPVTSSTNFSGHITVNGSIRGAAGQEHYLLPGGYILDEGNGRLLIQNVSDNDLTIVKKCLLTRALPTIANYDVCAAMQEKIATIDEIQCGTQLTERQRHILKELLLKYSGCFSTGLKDLGFTTAGEMVIELKDAEPVVYRPYRLSYGERAHVRDMVQEMMEAGIVRESSSPYASPIVMVQKKTGEKRLCVDYRALNRRTKKDHYPLPRIEDQLDQLAGSKLFISLDLASGYYQIPISEASQDKTAFVTPDGQFEYTRMPFGLVNAPSVFQRTMNKILSDAKVKYALVYMDDILIPAGTFEEGITRLEEVLTLLQKGGLTLKLSKCHFFFDCIDFLGFEVSANGIKPGARKTEAVEKFSTPKNAHELRQFIGLASFFRRFVKGFAMIARPLTDLLKKNSEWKWEKSQSEAFHLLKDSLTKRPILALYDPKRETQVHTDACKYGIGGILLQKDDEGSLKPVAYYSRKTTVEEQRLHSFELETLAVVSSLARFRVYLIGLPFKIITDCNALRTTMTKRDLVPRIARWWIQLQEFDCDIEYRAGSTMSHADALSRNPVSEAVEESHVLDVLTVGTEDWIATVQSNDEEISRIKGILCDPGTENVADIVKNYKLKNDKVFRITGKDGTDLRWVVPKGVRWQITKMNHDDLGHFGYEKTLSRIQQSFWFPKMRRFVKKYVRSCLECAYHKGASGKQEGQLHPIPKPDIPFHTVHADHLGPFVRSGKGNTYLLVIVDGFTKFVNITPVRNTKTSSTIKVLREHMSYFGAPARLITDRGTSFTSNSFQSFIKSLSIKHILNAVSTPRANGQVERFNRSILEALSAKCRDKNDRNWDDYIPNIQLGFNTTIHKTTGKSPSELVFGFKVNSGSENILSDVIIETINKSSTEDLTDIRHETAERISNQQEKDKERFDAKRKMSHVYSVGDLVSLKRDVPSDGNSMKLAPKYQGPYRITKLLPNERFVVQDTPLTKKKNHRGYDNVVAIDKLKPWLNFDKNFGSSSESEHESKDD